MVTTFFYSIASVVAISLVAFIGIFTLSFKSKNLKKVVIYFVSFAAGALLGDVFLHLLPEAVEEHGFGMNISLLVLGGIGFSFIIEKFIHWRHCHMSMEHDHQHPVALMNLVGDGVHNFIDGVIVAASYIVSIPVGIATTIAVFLHEIPQEIGDFGILIHGGYSVKKALLLNFLLALTSLIGVGVVFAIGAYAENLLFVLIPIAAGTFLYIAGSDLIPELHKENGTKQALLQLLFMIIGVAVMAALLFLE